MKVDIRLLNRELLRLGPLAAEAEALGVDGVWAAETVHDPFLQSALIAQATRRAEVGPGVAAAFPRSPMVLAYSAWDLQLLSGGRFVLGLGSQVKGHVVRRFGMAWDPPVAKMRDTVEALRAIWRAWGTRQQLNYQGQFYKLDMVNLHFTPDPIPYPSPRIFLGGINHKMVRLAGEVADGLFVHPVHTPKYLRSVVLPEVAAGAREAGRPPGDVELAVTVLVATGPDSATLEEQRELMRAELAFHGATRTYRLPFEIEGWGELVPWLHQKAAANEPDAARSAITDEMLDAFGVVAPPDELGQRIRERYAGLAHRIAVMTPFDPEQNIIPWPRLVEALKG